MKNFYYRNPDVNRLEIKVPEEKENPAKTALILAIFKMPFMHKLTKSMAENTYVRSKGQNILKTKIDSNTSKTLEQQMQRLRVKQLTQLCKVLNTPIRKGFVERWATWSAWNAFQSAATPAILVSEALEVTVDYEKLPVAKGSLEFEIENVSISSDSDAGTLTVTSPASDYGFGSEPTDTLQLGGPGEGEDAQPHLPGRHAGRGLHGERDAPRRLEVGERCRVCVHAVQEWAEGIEFGLRAD